MLITFKSQAAADLIMLNDSAEALLHLLGKTTAGPGILEPKDMPAALGTLRALTADGPEPISPVAEDEDEPKFVDEPVSMRQRVWPFIRMLEQAQRAGKPIVWGV